MEIQTQCPFTEIERPSKYTGIRTVKSQETLQKTFHWSYLATICICAARFLLTKPTFSLGRIDKKTAFEGSARIVFGKQLGWYETPRSTTAWKVTFLFLPSDESTLHSTGMCREYKILKNRLDSTGKVENACIAILLSCTAAQGQIGHPALLISYFALTLYLWLSFMHLTN